MTDNRTTNRPEARPDLFQLVAAYYREHFEREGRGEEFARWSTASGGDLQEAARYGADPALLLHVLVCTADRRVRRYRDELDGIRRLEPGQKTLLIGALKLLQRLGEAWLKEVLGQAEADRAHRLFTDITVLSHLLGGGTTTTPAWQSGFGRVPTSRQRQHALTACMVCLMEALKHHPKPAAATVTLLEKFELIPKGVRGGPTALAFVVARVRRSRVQVRDRLSPVGNVVWFLASTYTELKDFLQPPEEIEPTAEIWEERAKVWGTSAAEFRTAFHRFCEWQGFRRDHSALDEFDRSLTFARETQGDQGLRRVWTDPGPAAENL